MRRLVLLIVVLAAAVAAAGPAWAVTLEPGQLDDLRTLTLKRPAPAPDRAVQLRRTTMLYDRPGGRVVARLKRRTEYKLRRVLPVLKQEGEWLGVVVTERPNKRLGWIRASGVRELSVDTRVEIDLSERRLRVRRGGRTIHRMTIAVGSDESPTPTGIFGVTDHLKGFGPYGCCILALSARQPKLRTGWHGGDRVAIHGTSDPASVGTPVSNGCMRGHEKAMRKLLRIVHNGSQVRISA